MNDLVQADIFFFISSLAAVLLTIAVLVAMWYIVHILRNIKNISDRAEVITEELQQDFEELRTKIKTQSMGITTAINFFRNLWPGTGKNRTSGRKKASQE